MPLSCLYSGWVSHTRLIAPKRTFRYSLTMAYLDLDELPEALDGRWLWSARRLALARFRREDHLGDPAVPLQAAVRDLVESRTGRRPEGPIRLLTNLRSFGYLFNPVSFHYCFDASGERLEAVVADMQNTPWNERHAEVLEAPVPGGGPLRASHPKTFHVSPFLPMDSTYAWRFDVPGERLRVSVATGSPSGRRLQAGLSMERRELTGPAMARSLVRHPFMSGMVVTAIYWQALRLLLAGAATFTHPGLAAPDRLPRANQEGAP